MAAVAIVALGLVLSVTASALSGGNDTVAGLIFVAFVALVVAPVIALRARYTRRRRLGAKTLGELLIMTPKEFEAAVANLLRDLGYHDVQLFGGPGDLSADIVCRDRKGRRTVVQCKRRAPGIRVGSPEVQSFIGMMFMHHQAECGMFVTTSGFTQPAIELARRHSI